MKKIFVILLLFPILLLGQKNFKIATLKYNGGGDWYANPTSLPNLIKFCNKNINTNIYKNPDIVEASSNEIFNYPFLHMTGHGNVIFNNIESENIRKYLIAGGFIHIDDNYGMDPFIRIELKKIFPEIELKELSKDHPIFHGTYKFKNGLPKIHQHDNKRAQAFGIIHDGRLVCLYTYECDLSDGWEDEDVHNNSEETRQKALKMGANIIEYVFKN